MRDKSTIMSTNVLCTACDYEQAVFCDFHCESYLAGPKRDMARKMFPNVSCDYELDGILAQWFGMAPVKSDSPENAAFMRGFKLAGHKGVQA